MKKIHTDVNEWITACKGKIYVPSSSFGRNDTIIQRAICEDGYSISIQASSGHYCLPRVSDAYYEKVELGYPSEPTEEIMEYAEDKDNPTNTVYGYVPVEIIKRVLKRHGGIKNFPT